MRYFEILLKVPGKLSRVHIIKKDDAPRIGDTTWHRYLEKMLEITHVREVFSVEEFRNLEYEERMQTLREQIEIELKKRL